MTDDPHIGPCRYCGDNVRWLRHAVTGKLAPIDMAPDPTGNVVVGDGMYTVIAKPIDQPGDEPRHLNHRVTCPAVKRTPPSPVQTTLL